MKVDIRDSLVLDYGGGAIYITSPDDYSFFTIDCCVFI
jgi:hypothetical protein